MAEMAILRHFGTTKYEVATTSLGKAWVNQNSIGRLAKGTGGATKKQLTCEVFCLAILLVRLCLAILFFRLDLILNPRSFFFTVLNTSMMEPF